MHLSPTSKLGYLSFNMCPKTSASCITLSYWRRRVQSEYTLILVLVVSARCIIKTWIVAEQSHKLLTFLSSPLMWGHIYIWHVETFISARGHTHKNINITTCTNTCHLIGLPIRQSWLESDENWTRPIFLQHCRMVSRGVLWGDTRSDIRRFCRIQHVVCDISDRVS